MREALRDQTGVEKSALVPTPFADHAIAFLNRLTSTSLTFLLIVLAGTLAQFAGSGVLKSSYCPKFADRTTPKFSVVDLSNFVSLRCTAIKDVLRNSMVSFKSGGAWL